MPTSTTPRGRRTLVVGLASAGTGIAGLIIGSILGATAGGDSEPATATETITVTDYNSDALSMAGDAIVAASEFDTGTLNAITEELGVMKDEMDPYVLSYATNAGLCRDATEGGQ